MIRILDMRRDAGFRLPGAVELDEEYLSAETFLEKLCSCPGTDVSQLLNDANIIVDGRILQKGVPVTQGQKSSFFQLMNEKLL